jgi:cellulose synthase/poly-beta-1,6-N-acetylglucosamine synthase-like glycosyltransferase
MPVVSVITACHSGMQHFLDECARSVLHQVLPESWELEWRLQFDAHDSSSKLGLVDPRVLVDFNGQQLGTAETRNRAIARSSGDVLIQLDGDDVLVPGALTTLLRYFDDEHVGWVVGRADDLYPDGSTKPFIPPITGDVAAGQVSTYWLKNRILPCHSAGFCARRDLVVASGGYPPLGVAEDVGLVLAVTDASAGRLLADLTTLYRKWPGQTTASPGYYGSQRDDCLRLIERQVRARARR